MGSGRVNAYKALIHAINNTCSFISVTGTQTTRKVHCRNITLENATIPIGVKLELYATEKVIIGNNVTVNSGGTLEIEAGGGVSYYSNIIIESGVIFINH